jgi:hypothetical protein
MRKYFERLESLSECFKRGRSQVTYVAANLRNKTSLRIGPYHAVAGVPGLQQWRLPCQEDRSVGWGLIQVGPSHGRSVIDYLVRAQKIFQCLCRLQIRDDGEFIRRNQVDMGKLWDSQPESVNRGVRHSAVTYNAVMDICTGVLRDMRLIHGGDTVCDTAAADPGRRRRCRAGAKSFVSVSVLNLSGSRCSPHAPRNPCSRDMDVQSARPNQARPNFTRTFTVDFHCPVAAAGITRVRSYVKVYSSKFRDLIRIPLLQ